MSVHHADLNISSRQRCCWIDITDQVAQAVGTSGIADGIVCIASVHTTAGITINENADPDVGRDFFWKLAQVFPNEPAFHHSEGNSDSHIKASLVGLSVLVPLRDSVLSLGTWQSIYFCEFDGPRNRSVTVTIVGV